MRKDREAAKRLLHAIGDIDDQYLLEAEEQPMKQTKKQISNRWMKYVAVAACAGIVLTSGILIQQERNKSHLYARYHADRASHDRRKRADSQPIHSLCHATGSGGHRWLFVGCSGMPMGHMTTRPFRQSKGK